MTHEKTDNLSPFAPLKQPVFRMLWLTWLMANLCMWMNDVAAAWMMASISTSATIGEKRRSFQLGHEPLRVTKTFMETAAG